MNDNSSATIKTSHRTKVFTFLTLDECVGGSLVILPFGKNIIRRALRFAILLEGKTSILQGP